MQQVVQPLPVNLLAIILRSIGAKLDWSETQTGAGPLAVFPWARNKVVAMLRVVLFHCGIKRLRAYHVFLVPPARDVQDRQLRFADVGSQRAFFPESVAVGMFNEVVPGRNLSVEIVGVGVGERSQCQVPVVGVAAIELEVVVLGLGGLEQRGVLEPVTKTESAVMVKVVIR